MLDVVIAGGGPAGLSAALLLGRARRSVLLVDSGQPRNAGVHAMHGFLSHDGMDPAALRQAGRDQLKPYPTVQLRAAAVHAVTRDAEGFTVSLTDRTTAQARRLLLATGVVDQLPPIPGLAELWGRGVFNCPYCNGWEVRDQPLAVLASDPRNFQLALQLTRWSPDVLLASNGPAGLDDDARRLLAAHKAALREEPIARLDGEDGGLERRVR
jgi:thioredoxin reductase